jgi:hypothetical protein
MQAPILAGFDAGETRLVPIATISDAVADAATGSEAGEGSEPADTGEATGDA